MAWELSPSLPYLTRFSSHLHLPSIVPLQTAPDREALPDCGGLRGHRGLQARPEGPTPPAVLLCSPRSPEALGVLTQAQHTGLAGGPGTAGHQAAPARSWPAPTSVMPTLQMETSSEERGGGRGWGRVHIRWVVVRGEGWEPSSS